MSKYQKLWEYVEEQGETSLMLSFTQIETVLGFAIDHSFLNYKKELTDYGYQVKKISLKEKNVLFEKSE